MALVGKIQKIEPILNETETSFSGTIAITPDERESINKKGYLYAVFEILSKTPQEPTLAFKLIKDILGRSYYHSENISPIQALEKAILEVQKDVALWGAESQENEVFKKSEEIRLNIIASVLWAGVLYTVRFGDGSVAIMRGGSFKEAGLISEGNFSVATGMTKKEDVLILSTKDFSQKFSYQKLLEFTSEDVASLNPTECCLMIKLETDKTLVEEMQINENFGKNEKKPKFLTILGKFTKKLAQMYEGKKKIPGIQEIGQKQHRETNKKPVSIAITIILVFALIMEITRSQNTSDIDGVKETSKTGKAPDVQKSEPRPENKGGKENKESKEQEKTQKEIFYDLKITNPKANPISLDILDNKIYVMDKNGDLYTSDLNTPHFTKVANTKFENPSIIRVKENEIFIKNDVSIKNYSPETQTTKETIVGKGTVFYPYLSYIYQIEGSEIKKYEIEGANEKEGVIWAENQDFQNAKDMAISVSIYILTKDNELVRYTSGVKEVNFRIKGLDTKLKDSSGLKTNWDWENLYIVDSGNGRVVILNKNGDFVKELKGQNEGWADLRSVTVTNVEDRMFVLDGTRIFEIKL